MHGLMKVTGAAGDCGVGVMRRVIAALVALACVGAVASAPTADAAAKKYRNCTSMHKRYPLGVAKSRAAANRNVWVMGRPKVSASLYKANTRLDRDHDGVACEAR